MTSPEVRRQPANLWFAALSHPHVATHTALHCEPPPQSSAFHVNIVTNDTLSEHTCYYGLPSKQRSSLPRRPTEKRRGGGDAALTQTKITDSVQSWTRQRWESFAC